VGCAPADAWTGWDRPLDLGPDQVLPAELFAIPAD